MTRAELITAIARRLARAGIEDPRREARLLLARGVGLGMEALIAEPRAPLSRSELRKAAMVIRRRAAREPLSRIVETREFWSREFLIDASVLDPRPASETLVEVGLAKVAASASRSPGPCRADWSTSSSRVTPTRPWLIGSMASRSSNRTPACARSDASICA